MTWSNEEETALTEAILRLGNQWNKIKQEYGPEGNGRLSLRINGGRIMAKARSIAQQRYASGQDVEPYGCILTNTLKGAVREPQSTTTGQPRQGTTQSAKRLTWTESQDQALLDGYKQYGSKWKKIAREFPVLEPHNKGTRLRDRVATLQSKEIRKGGAVGVLVPGKERLLHDTPTLCGDCKRKLDSLVCVCKRVEPELEKCVNKKTKTSQDTSVQVPQDTSVQVPQDTSVQDTSVQDASVQVPQDTSVQTTLLQERKDSLAEWVESLKKEGRNLITLTELLKKYRDYYTSPPSPGEAGFEEYLMVSLHLLQASSGVDYHAIKLFKYNRERDDFLDWDTKTFGFEVFTGKDTGRVVHTICSEVIQLLELSRAYAKSQKSNYLLFREMNSYEYSHKLAYTLEIISGNKMMSTRTLDKIISLHYQNENAEEEKHKIELKEQARTV